MYSNKSREMNPHDLTFTWAVSKTLTERDWSTVKIGGYLLVSRCLSSNWSLWPGLIKSSQSWAKWKLHAQFSFRVWHSLTGLIWHAWRAPTCWGDARLCMGTSWDITGPASPMFGDPLSTDQQKLMVDQSHWSVALLKSCEIKQSQKHWMALNLRRSLFQLEVDASCNLVKTICLPPSWRFDQWSVHSCCNQQLETQRVSQKHWRFALFFVLWHVRWNVNS